MPGGSEIEALKAFVAHNQSWSDWSTIAVFIGLLGEIAITFAYTKDKPRSEIILGVVCGAVIAFGVYGEYRFGSKAAQGNAQLQNISDMKVAELNKEAGEARRTAGEAIREAGQSNERAGKLEKEAASARRATEWLRKQNLATAKELLQLQEKVAWRKISPKQADIIREHLKPFQGRQIVLEWASADPEQDLFAKSLLAAFTNADLLVKPDISAYIAGLSPGIFILFGTDSEDLAGAIAKALVDASIVDARVRVDKENITGIKVMVGPRVQK